MPGDRLDEAAGLIAEARAAVHRGHAADIRDCWWTPTPVATRRRPTPRPATSTHRAADHCVTRGRPSGDLPSRRSASRRRLVSATLVRAVLAIYLVGDRLCGRRRGHLPSAPADPAERRVRGGLDCQDDLHRDHRRASAASRARSSARSCSSHSRRASSDYGSLYLDHPRSIVAITITVLAPYGLWGMHDADIGRWPCSGSSGALCSSGRGQPLPPVRPTGLRRSRSVTAPSPSTSPQFASPDDVVAPSARRGLPRRRRRSG